MADIGFNVGFEAAKKSFFDTPAVMDRVAEAELKKLSKFGAFVRQNARLSLRRPRRQSLTEMSDDDRKDYKKRAAIAKFYGRPVPKRPFASSQPGEPPRNVTGRIKNFIFFSYDASSRSVVIGPVLLNAPTGAPEILEEGGTTEVTAGPDKGMSIFVKPRPYMRPSFNKALDDLPGLFGNSV